MNQPQTARYSRGFTLMELMVVLVLMGIILSMTTLTVGDGGQSRKLEEEARRLVTLIRMAQEEVIIRAEEWEVNFYEDSYTFQTVERGVGDKIENKGKLIFNETKITNKIFRKRGLPEFKLTIVREDEKKVFTIYNNADTADEDFIARGDDIDEGVIERIRISPSGEMTPFELKIQSETLDDYFVITGNEFGELTLKNAKEL